MIPKSLDKYQEMCLEWTVLEKFSMFCEQLRSREADILKIAIEAKPKTLVQLVTDAQYEVLMEPKERRLK